MELMAHMDKVQLHQINLHGYNHMNRHTLRWGKSRQRVTVNKLESNHLYNILKGIKEGRFRNPGSKMLWALELEAEMRGILVNGELRDPSLEGGRVLPFGLIDSLEE